MCTSDSNLFLFTFSICHLLIFYAFGFLVMIVITYPDFKSLNFSCGRNHTLFLREDVSAMEAAAKRFEKEDGILEDIRQKTRSGDELYSYPASNKYLSVLDDGYSPYCEINFDFNADIAAIIQDHSQYSNQSTSICGTENFRPEASGTSVACSASTLCPSGELTESSSAANNVRSSFLFPKLAA